MNQMKRDNNIELLRVISMFMILMLHYFNQGEVLELTENKGGITYYLIWTIEAICYISVNIYMLISGFFLSERAYSWRRLISFYSTVLFYSITISAFCFLFGIAELNIRNILAVFPIVGSRSNWFVTIYIAILLISPLLNTIVNSLDKEIYKRMLFILLIMFCIFPTVFYWIDQFNIINGYSILWYGYLYLIAAYLKRFAIRLKVGQLAVMISLLAFLPICKFFSARLENHLYAYNSAPCFFAALAVFIIFVSRKATMPLWFARIIAYWGKTSFGVFFIHSFVLLRDYLWVRLGSTKYINNPFQIIHALICIVIVYVVCSLLESGRELFFRGLGIDSFVTKISHALDERFPM